MNAARDAAIVMTRRASPAVRADVLEREPHEVRAAREPELLHDSRAIRLDGLDAQAQLVGDLGIGEPLGDARHDLTLARRELRRLAASERLQAFPQHGLLDRSQAARDVHEGPSLGNRADRREQLRVHGALHDVSDGARVGRGAHVSDLVVDGQDEDPRLRPDALDRGDGGQAPSGIDVHEQDVGLRLLDAARRPDVAGLAHDLHVGLAVMRGAQAAPQTP
jgi:hypothetical protein